MSDTDDQVSDFVAACVLIAEADLSIMVEHKNPELQGKLRYFAPSALEALAQLELLIHQKTAAELIDTNGEDTHVSP